MCENEEALWSLNPSVLILSQLWFQKGQLGRPFPDEDRVKSKKGLWHAVPSLVPGIGSKHGRRAVWIGASGEQTFLRIDESLINAHTLSRSSIVANQDCIGERPQELTIII